MSKLLFTLFSIAGALAGSRDSVAQENERQLYVCEASPSKLAASVIRDEFGNFKHLRFKIQTFSGENFTFDAKSVERNGTLRVQPQTGRATRIFDIAGFEYSESNIQNPPQSLEITLVREPQELRKRHHEGTIFLVDYARGFKAEFNGCRFASDGLHAIRQTAHPALEVSRLSTLDETASRDFMRKKPRKEPLKAGLPFAISFFKQESEI